jgi:hypothetical protein
MSSTPRPRFNRPPNWYALPAGWQPDPGWEPDSSLPPAPPGWPLWVIEPEPPPERPLKRSPVTLAIAVVVIVLVVGLLIFFIVSKGNIPKPSAGQPGSPCALFTPLRAHTDSKAFMITMRITSLCPGGTVLSQNSRVTVAANGQDVAAGMFDFAAAPILVPPGGYVLRDLRFPVGMFWRTPESLPQLDPTAATSSAVDVRYDPPVQLSPANPPPRHDALAPIDASGPAPPRNGDVEAASVAGLNVIADADHQPIDAQLKDKWLPQLSIKWKGQEWQGFTYADPDIINEHLRMRLAFDNVRLARAVEWTTLNDTDHPDAWVTLAGSTSPDANGANGWCDSKGLGPNDCFARLISTANPPPEPNHVYR